MRLNDLNQVTPVDPTIIKTFLAERLKTKEEVARTAIAVGVSTATLYRYKSNPEDMAIGVLVKLKDILGLPLENGAAWSKMRVIDTEHRRLQLEEFAAKAGGARYTTVAPYSVNSEIEDITQVLLRLDYGTRATALEKDLMNIRRKRAALYKTGLYESWEIWDGYGYADFFHGRGRFSGIDEATRHRQVATFIESSRHPKRRRFIYRSHCPTLPMFGCYQPQDVALIRVEDVHFEFQAPELVRTLRDTFDDLLSRCSTTTPEQFIEFLATPDM